MPISIHILGRLGRCWHWPSPSVTPIPRTWATCFQGPLPSMTNKNQEVRPFRSHCCNAWMAFTRKRADGSLHVKAVSQTYRQPSARLRFAGAPISSHCRQIPNFDNLVNLVLKRFRRGLNHQFGYAVRDRHPEVSQNLSDFRKTFHSE